MYKVLHDFADLNDHNHIYHTGEKFPRTGSKVSPERISELSGYSNKLKKPLIQKVKGKNDNNDGDVPVSEKLVQPKARRK